MAQIDTSSVLLLDTRVGKDGGMQMQMHIRWDFSAEMHRITMWDTNTKNDASRCVTEGRDMEGTVPVKSFVDAMPEMIEEIIVLNKLMGPSV